MSHHRTALTKPTFEGGPQMAELTFNVLWEILNYDFGTGKLFWRERPRKYFKTDRHWNAWNVRFANK